MLKIFYFFASFALLSACVINLYDTPTTPDGVTIFDKDGNVVEQGSETTPQVANNSNETSSTSEDVQVVGRSTDRQNAEASEEPKVVEESTNVPSNSSEDVQVVGRSTDRQNAEASEEPNVVEVSTNVPSAPAVQATPVTVVGVSDGERSNAEEPATELESSQNGIVVSYVASEGYASVYVPRNARVTADQLWQQIVLVSGNKCPKINYAPIIARDGYLHTPQNMLIDCN